ncbi:MAG: hypothetical protein Ta2A_08340 [Treponemataceae bacterium]|nr:MAG: hypothetical protein Ta2A_08340 [Treponemataceae bacterium]
MLNPKHVSIIALAGFIISFLLALVSGCAVLTALVRALICAAVTGAVVAACGFFAKKYSLDEVVSISPDAPVQTTHSSLVDIVLGDDDEELPVVSSDAGLGSGIDDAGIGSVASDIDDFGTIDAATDILAQVTDSGNGVAGSVLPHSAIAHGAGAQEAHDGTQSAQTAGFVPMELTDVAAKAGAAFVMDELDDALLDFAPGSGAKVLPEIDSGMLPEIPPVQFAADDGEVAAKPAVAAAAAPATGAAGKKKTEVADTVGGDASLQAETIRNWMMQE